MNRTEKLKLLKAIKAGKANIESLQPPKFYIFEESNKKGYFKMNGKEYDVKYYKDFCQRAERKNALSIFWGEILQVD